MSSINLTQINPQAVPAPANGEVEFFVDTASEPTIKLPDGSTKVLGATFGSRFITKKRSDTQTTTGTGFTNYDTLNLNNLPTGNYKIEMRWVWGYASGSNDIRVRWILDNANEIIPEHRQEPKDGGTDQRYHECSFEVLSLGGNHNITVEFASSANGNQARMYQTQMIVYRID